MEKGILVISHNDLDGVACVILLKRSTDKPVEYVLADYNSVDYEINQRITREAQHKYSQIFITDICPLEGTCMHINQQYSAGVQVKLLDHHTTRSWVNDYPWATYENHICGCELVYEYITKHFPVGESKAAEQDWMFAQAVGAWDLWRVSSPHRPRGEELNSLLRFIGKDSFIRVFSEDINQDKKEFQSTISYLADKKKRYVGSVLANQLDSAPIHSDGQGLQFKIIFATDYVSDIGDSILRHPDYEDIDYVVLVNPVMNAVSLRSRKGDVDVARLAKRLGGGGHKSAAGFSKNFTYGIDKKLSNLLNLLEY